MASRQLSLALQRRSPDDTLDRRILAVRGHKVLLDADLAAVFGVATRVLNQTVRRNRSRFPPDFMLALTPAEVKRLRSQIVISNGGRGGRRSPPFAFTEHGAIMLASLLNSPTAVAASIRVVRAFVRLRSAMAVTDQVLERIDVLEASCDKRFRVVFQALRTLVKPLAAPARRTIGFAPAESSSRSSELQTRLPESPHRLPLLPWIGRRPKAIRRGRA